jgi:rubrerythrin
MNLTQPWCAKCGVHLVDDPRLELCPVCQDIDRRATDAARARIGHHHEETA